jgi:ABC-type glutathione transport system ATPase component
VKAAKAVVLVTHDMGWVREYCNRAILLEHGQVIIEGTPDEVVEAHLERTARAKAERESAARAAGMDPSVGLGRLPKPPAPPPASPG